MLPHQRNKVDINSLNEEERKLFRLYGKLPTKSGTLLKKNQERKYFDSGDYALSKAGKASVVGVTNIGSQHPLPENIPHISQKTNSEQQTGSSSSPVKEASHLHSKSPMASEEPITIDSVGAGADSDEEEDHTSAKAELGEEKKVKSTATEPVAVPA